MLYVNTTINMGGVYWIKYRKIDRIFVFYFKTSLKKTEVWKYKYRFGSIE